MKKVKIWAVMAMMLVAPAMTARADDGDSFLFWVYTEVNHDFKNGIYLTGYFEHDNVAFKRLDCNYFRFSGGYKVLPWLKLGVNYVPVFEADNSCYNYGEFDVVGTLKSGNFNVSIRERVRHGFTDGKNELRSRLKVAYSIPGSKFGVYLAPEVFTWGTQWTKTRHYVFGTYDITDKIMLEVFYMYYALNGSPAQQVAGFGFSFDI